MKKYFPLKQYSMKCRLYPNKHQQEIINNQLHMIHVYHNNLIHDMRVNGKYLNEVEDKKNPGNYVHFPGFKTIDGLEYGMKAADFYKEYIKEDPRMKAIPIAVFSNKTRSIINDMEKAYGKTGNHPVEQWGEKYTDKDGNQIEKGIKYYTKSNPRHSYWTQIPASRIHRIPECELENGEVIYKYNSFFIYIPKVGHVKVRGWNKDIRFDEDGKMDFLTWVEANPRKQISCNINKDKCGNFYISFAFGNSKSNKDKNPGGPVVWKNINIPEKRIDVEGVDVGETNLAITASGEKFDNIFDYNKKVEHLYRKIEYLQNKRARAWGYANEKFIKENNKIKKENAKKKEMNESLQDDQKQEISPLLVPSKAYNELTMKINKCFRKISQIKEDYYHKVANYLVTKANTLGVENLSVSGMFEDKESTPEKTNRQRRKHNRNIADASMYMFLSKIGYKCKWFDTELIEADQYFASSQICHVCGYKNDKLKDPKIKECTCPQCKTHLDRDINAAINILNMAKAKKLHSVA